MLLKIIAYAFSRSMSVLASTVDSVLDILSGLVLFITSRLAGTGVRKGDVQRTVHQSGTSAAADAPALLYPIGKRRYQTLGVMAFACVMGTFALFLIYESIVQIVELASAPPEHPTVFDTLQIVIIGFTIALKAVLFGLCHAAGKVCPAQRESLHAYRDDHRNDVLSNSLGFVAAFIGARYYGQDGLPNLSYIDPIGSVLLGLYILINWSRGALEQMRSMVGHSAPLNVAAAFCLRAMHSSVLIERVGALVAYQSGNEATVEIHIQMPDELHISECHEVVQRMQGEFEVLEGVERCFVHVESTKCRNEF